MEPTLILKLPTDDPKEIEYFKKAFKKGSTVLIPDCVKILLKNKEGYWREAK